MTSLYWGRTQVEWTYNVSELETEIGVCSWQWLPFWTGTAGALPPDTGSLPGDWNATLSDVSTTSSDWTTESTWQITPPSGSPFLPSTYHDSVVMPALQTFLTAFNISKCVTFTKVSSYLLASGGRGAIPGSACVSTWTTPPTPAGVIEPVPLQLAAVVSLQTPQLGRKGRGRFFLPVLDLNAIGTDANLVGTQQTAIKSAAAALMPALYQASTSDVHVGAIPIVTGHTNPLTYGVVKEVRVSSLFDTQRRRRDRLSPSYAVEAVSY